MNDFQTSYSIAENGKLEPFWSQVYSTAFPNMVNQMHGKDGKCQSQTYGVDRIIYLENGKTITVEEKVRTTTRDDILLEYISNDNKNTPGWMEKDLSVDYLAYAFLPTQTVYLFDWRMLKLAWNKNKSNWLSKYFIAKAPNEYYTTYSVCVPIKKLLESCKEASVIRV
jgi:hypothetical protein